MARTRSLMTVSRQRESAVEARASLGVRPPHHILANTAQPGASRVEFNKNFPLAEGHSSRSLRFKIPVPLW